MRATLRRIIAILDGTPTGARGQSLVELTLTLPILLIMLLGLTEIGWYANNYLTLLDVVREAGRFGASRDPLEWPTGEELNYSRLDCEEISTIYDKLPFENNTNPKGPTDPVFKYRDRGERPVGYYDGVACSAVRNMAPLEFKDDEDDIVISVFQFFVLNRGTPNATVRIYGRHPALTNECTGDDSYDPFDWNHNGLLRDAGEDPNLGDDAAIDPGNVRGFVFRGNHKIDGTSCIGSDFSTLEVEEMLDFKGDPDRARKMEQVANFGLVLVELYWSHDQLLGLPWFNLGPLDEGNLIHVWTFFPVSAAEPDID
jgi:hypothetical protein